MCWTVSNIIILHLGKNILKIRTTEHEHFNLNLGYNFLNASTRAIEFRIYRTKAKCICDSMTVYIEN